MKLPNDVARCNGVFDTYKDRWREGCEDCLRRTTEPPAALARVVNMQPPERIGFACIFRIEQ